MDIKETLDRCKPFSGGKPCRFSANRENNINSARLSCKSLRNESPVYTLLRPAIATLRTSRDQTFVGTMKAIHFVYLIIFAAIAGVNAVPIDDARTCLVVCASSPRACAPGSKATLLGKCWTCCRGT